MARPKSPCGTYPAYQRHLREKTAVDAACRRAQQKHDVGRGRTLRAGDVERPVVMPVTVTPKVDVVEQRETDAHARFFDASKKLAVASSDDSLYPVIDLMQELDELLDAWVFAADEVDASRDFPDHPEELRAGLIAAWLESARDDEAGPDEISDELRALILSRTYPESSPNA